MYRGTDNKEWVDRASLEYVDDSEVYVNKLSSGRAATMGGFCSKEALFSAGAIIQTPDKGSFASKYLKRGLSTRLFASRF